MATKNPATVTFYGRLSFPRFTYKDALEANRKAPTNVQKADESTVTPDFNLLVEAPQFEKYKRHVIDVFLPHCVELLNAGGKRGVKSALEQGDVDKLVKLIESGDWDMQPPYISIKPVHEKTQELMPDAVAMIKVVGQRGVDVELKAIVNNEDELLVPDPDLLSYPVIKPINQTVHSMYPGCYVAVTANLYSFVSGKLPGFSSSASVAVFKADGDRFGGGVSIDEEDIFAD